jgi:ring-1,2-phenylacetyl-CoA epoxidase subunit PaaD
MQNRLDAVWELLRAVPDPEIPVVSICDLGIVRAVHVDKGDESVEVVITPTYAGCPAMHMIEESILSALHGQGIAHACVTTTLSPPWTTDWITPDGRAQLKAYGIAPPAPVQPGSAQVIRFDALRHRAAEQAPACPLCGSVHTERLAQFGSTACKALYRCLDCREPFDYFKPY